jgi:hypothetical protein
MNVIISYKICAVKVRNAKLRNYLKRFLMGLQGRGGGGAYTGTIVCVSNKHVSHKYRIINMY